MSFPATSALEAPRLGALGRLALRYGPSVAGPVAVSGAHFLASLIFLGTLPANQFGLFSFVMVSVSFAMSANGALIGMPLTLAGAGAKVRAASFQANGPLCLGAGLLLFAALWFSGAAPGMAALLAVYGAVFTFRWFARCLAYVEGRIAVSVGSDLVYGTALVTGLGALKLGGHLTFAHGAQMLLVAALAALIPYGRDFFRRQAAALGWRSLGDYARLFREHTRWALLGVALTELTVNAHAYLVTFISGPGAFALLALGFLLMRPASLVQGALPDLERPAMARAIHRGDGKALARICRELTAGLGGAWLANILLCAGILAIAPGLVLHKGYALHDVVMVMAIAGAIMAARVLRTPPSVQLQAAGWFKALARIGTESAAVSVAATLLLLMVFGPIASLGGILLGEVVMLVRTLYLARRWRRDVFHG